MLFKWFIGCLREQWKALIHACIHSWCPLCIDRNFLTINPGWYIHLANLYEVNTWGAVSILYMGIHLAQSGMYSRLMWNSFCRFPSLTAFYIVYITKIRNWSWLRGNGKNNKDIKYDEKFMYVMVSNVLVYYVMWRLCIVKKIYLPNVSLQVQQLSTCRVTGMFSGVFSCGFMWESYLETKAVNWRLIVCIQESKSERHWCEVWTRPRNTTSSR